MIPPRHDVGGGARDSVKALDVLAPLLKRAATDVVVKHHGDSMHPTIPNGCSIRVSCDAGTNAVRGDVVAMRTSAGLVTHRLMYRQREKRAATYVITRGDATWLPDAPLPAGDLLGVVTEVEVDGCWRGVETFTLTGFKGLAGWGSLTAMSLALMLHVGFARATFKVINRAARFVRFVRRGVQRSTQTRRTRKKTR